MTGLLRFAILVQSNLIYIVLISDHDIFSDYSLYIGWFLLWFPLTSKLSMTWFQKLMIQSGLLSPYLLLFSELTSSLNHVKIVYRICIHRFWIHILYAYLFTDNNTFIMIQGPQGKDTALRQCQDIFYFSMVDGSRAVSTGLVPNQKNTSLLLSYNHLKVLIHQLIHDLMLLPNDHHWNYFLSTNSF